jgi:uncharacterized Zn-finger protein
MDVENGKEQKEHQCHKCHRTFTLRSTLTRHLQRKTPCDTIHRCPICLLTFKKKSRLQRHLARKNICRAKEPPKLPKPYTCNLCGETFSRKSAKVRHDNLSCKIRKIKPEEWLRTIERLKNKLKIVKTERDKYYDLYRKIKDT